MRDQGIDTSDIPELDDDFFDRAQLKLPSDDDQKVILRQQHQTEPE